MNFLRHLPRFRRAYKLLDRLAERERWSRQEIEAFQLQRLNELWRHAAVHVPYYRQLKAKAGLPPQFDSLAQFQAMVPVLTKSEVRAEPKAFLSDRAERGGWHRTGGSTGAPMSVYWAKEARLEMLRARYRYYQMWGLDIFDPSAFLWGHSASLMPGLRGRIAKVRQPLEDWLRNRLRLSAYRLGREDLQEYLDRIDAFRPRSLYGYSQALYLLALEAEASGFHCDAIKLFTLTGEPALPYIVEKIEQVFGVPATVEYGAIESVVIAQEWPDRKLRVREDAVLLETIGRDDGCYDIVFTVLGNQSFPLLRYGIADVSDAPLERPERGFAVLKNVGGRNNDMIVTRSGQCIHSARFDALFKYYSRTIRRFRVRQRADGAVSVAVEAGDAASRLDWAGLRRAIRELVEGYPVTVEVVDSIPQTAAGKHRLVMSHMVGASQSNAASAGQDKQGGQSPFPLDAARLDQKIGTVPAPATPSVTQAGQSHLPADTAHRGQNIGTVPAPAPSKAKLLRNLIERPELAFLMEAHNGLSAKIVEEAGFEGIWGSGLAISASLGVRDSNEASWTQVLEVLDFMNDAVRLPILVDGDTGYGNFNNMRRLVQKLEQHGIAGVCIEDKIFPKTNSFIRGTAQPLADIDEFCGRISAGCDARRSDDFVIVARVEAFIAGWGLAEALKRAEAYRQAGADAILIHSAKRSAAEVLAFQDEWGGRRPVVIVPTKYYTTRTEIFRKHGFAAVIWANHLMRSCVTAMQRTSQQIFEEQSVVNVEDRIAALAEVFRIQGASELEEAEKRYLPRNAHQTRAVILAAARGSELGEMTQERPKCMVQISGQPILSHIVNTCRAAGIKDIAVVRGYRKEAVDLEGLTYFDNDETSTTGAVYSLYQAMPALDGPVIISYGDVLFKKYIAEELMETEADFAVFVDVNWRHTRNRGRTAQYVTCSAEGARKASCGPVKLLNISADLDTSAIHGEWMGFLKLSRAGARFLQDVLRDLSADPAIFRALDVPGLMRRLLEAGKEIQVIYTAGHWFDIDTVDDVLEGSLFQ
jgi:phosphoenolpyruvate phosphomutase